MHVQCSVNPVIYYTPTEVLKCDTHHLACSVAILAYTSLAHNFIICPGYAHTSTLCRPSTALRAFTSSVVIQYRFFCRLSTFFTWHLVLQSLFFCVQGHGRRHIAHVLHPCIGAPECEPVLPICQPRDDCLMLIGSTDCRRLGGIVLLFYLWSRFWIHIF